MPPSSSSIKVASIHKASDIKNPPSTSLISTLENDNIPKVNDLRDKVKSSSTQKSTVMSTIPPVKSVLMPPKRRKVIPYHASRPLTSNHQAAIRIQMLFLIYHAKLIVDKRRIKQVKAQKAAGDLIYWAVVTIQRVARGRLGRKRFAGFQIYREVKY